MRSLLFGALLLAACSSAGSSVPTPSQTIPSDYEPPTGSYQKPPSSYQTPSSNFQNGGGGSKSCPPCGGPYVCFASTDGGDEEFSVESQANSDGTCTYIEEVDNTAASGLLSCNGSVTQSGGVTGTWTAAGAQVTVCVGGACYQCTPGEAATPGGGDNDGG